MLKTANNRKKESVKKTGDFFNCKQKERGDR